MPYKKTYCALPANHTGKCRTEEAAKRDYAAKAARRAALMKSRQEWIASYKLEKGCERCGYNEDAVALDFDHLDRELKLANISAILWKRREDILAEIAKCRVLCSNCHRIVTRELEHYVATA